ncbi:TolC family protein [Undibacterium sp. CY18W]|uniref:TolC family protein n=1 Tax=Undibacterium hunanense TaxID=2762292 RepID=A0ABR6ZMB7_9BURK|nr:TolC family protein [Undibacterium hunanense]MBC3917022.1 TolC family protein [Undibacterium hunanense]
MQKFKKQKSRALPLMCGLLPLLPLLPLLLQLPAHAQVTAPTATVSMQQYLAAVENNSLDLQAQQELIASARAGISIAGVRPDPQLTAGIDSKELYGPNKPNTATTSTAGIAITLETANKRGARIQAAESNVRLTEAGVSAYRRQLLSDASNAFIEACRSAMSLARRDSSLLAMRDIVKMNETRFKTGDLGKLELVQSKVEADRFAMDVTSARADTINAEAQLSNFLGTSYQEIFAGKKIDCSGSQNEMTTDLATLTRQALEKREDVQVARSASDNAKDNIELAKANRWIDPVVNLGIKNTPRVNAIQNASGMVTNSPAERSNALSLTVTIPIPFSRTQSGELSQAQSALTQAQLQLRSTLIKAETEVRSSYLQYQAALQNIKNYKEHVLDDSERLLQGVRTSYRKGAASMLELLNAQRNADEIYQAYLQAEATLAIARVKLQQSTADQMK